MSDLQKALQNVDSMKESLAAVSCGAFFWWGLGGAAQRCSALPLAFGTIEQEHPVHIDWGAFHFYSVSYILLLKSQSISRSFTLPGRLTVAKPKFGYT